MSSVSSISAVSCLPLPSSSLSIATDTERGDPQVSQTPPADGRAPALASETAAALLDEQASPRQARRSGLDLSGMDLRATDLSSLDLKGANLRGSNLSGMDLSGLDLSGADLSEADLSEAVFTQTKLTNVVAQGVNLGGSVIDRVDLAGADFTRANFSSAYIAGIAADESIVGAQLMQNDGVRFDGANFQKAEIRGIGFAGSSADNADFSGATLDYLYFRESSVREASFDNASGFRLSLVHSDASGSAMTNMSVEYKGYSNTELNGVRFAGTAFNKTGFSMTNLSTADLTGVVREAKFAGFALTNLGGVDLSGFDFFGADFNDAAPGGGVTPRVAGWGASYQGTNFSGADFDHASFYQESDMGGANFAGARFNQTMIDGLAQSALANTNGVRESQGDAISLKEQIALLDMRTGRRPIERGFRMPEQSLPSAGTLHGLNDQDPHDRILLARAWAEAGLTGMKMDPLISKQDDSDSTEAPRVAKAARSITTVDSASAALETLRSANDKLRAEQRAKAEKKGDEGIVKLFKVEDAESDKL